MNTFFKKRLSLTLTYLCICFCFIASTPANLTNQKSCRSNSSFELSEKDLSTIKNRISDRRITNQELFQWDKIAANLMKNMEMAKQNQVIAYLYNAQNAFGKASFELTGSYSGTLDPISLYVLQLFFPSFQQKIAQDAFSEQITALLAKKIDRRFQKDKINEKPFVLNNESANSWAGKKPYDGITISSVQPWFLMKADEFRPKKPISDEQFWQDQLAITRKSVENATDQQKKLVLFWAGRMGEGSGDWMAIINDYMTKNKIPVSKMLEVRALLGSASLDATIAVFDTKYTYLMRRPYMLDRNFKPFIDTPNHPSYPSAHATIGSAIVVILNYYFPQNRLNWEKNLQEAMDSRIWGGIHFPIDNQVGKELGTKVGQKVLDCYLYRT